MRRVEITTMLQAPRAREMSVIENVVVEALAFIDSIRFGSDIVTFLHVELNNITDIIRGGTRKNRKILFVILCWAERG